MRRPDKTELEFAFLLAHVVLPFVFFAMRTVLTLVGG